MSSKFHLHPSSRHRPTSSMNNEGIPVDIKPKATPPAPSYEVFEPPSDWVRVEASDTVLLYLPGFKREQVKVQIDTYGNLRTTGERPLDGKRWSRFWKDFRIPDNCSVQDIQAKFENETLHVMLPKLIARDNAVEPQPAAAQKAEQGKRQKTNGKSTESVDAGLKPEKETEKEKLIPSKEKVADKEKAEDNKPSAVKKIAVGLSQGRKSSLTNVAVASLVLLGLVLYAKYKLTMAEASQTLSLVQE